MPFRFRRKLEGRRGNLRRTATLCLMAALCSAGALDGQPLVPPQHEGTGVEILADLRIAGEILGSEDLSALATTSDGSVLLLASDETNAVQVLARDDDTLRVLEDIPLTDDDDEEIDIESIARVDDRVFYVIGSHSWRRRNIHRSRDADSSYTEIKERFEEDTPDRERDRERWFRVELERLDPDDPDDPVDAAVEEQQTLTELLERNPVLQTYVRMPSKENGVDIEGAAFADGLLVLGFRSPTLRHGYVPMLLLEPGAPDGATHRYVRLDGRGVRDIAAVEGGFLILAGPGNEAPVSYEIYFWDGEDCLPGIREAGDPPRGATTRLATLPHQDGANPEGMAVIGETPESYEVIVVHDGVDRGLPLRLRVPKSSISRPRAGSSRADSPRRDRPRRGNLPATKAHS